MLLGALPIEGSVGPMIVWLNGTHGAGKTTTSALVQQLIPDSRVFDAEKVGETLMDITPGLPGTDNFQHWPPWRPLVVETARRVLDYTGGTLVMPMTVLVEQYWREISTGLAQHAIPVRHFVLHADQDTLRGRIAGDTVSAPPRSVSNTSSPTPRRPARVSWEGRPGPRRRQEVPCPIRHRPDDTGHRRAVPHVLVDFSLQRGHFDVVNNGSMAAGQQPPGPVYRRFTGEWWAAVLARGCTSALAVYPPSGTENRGRAGRFVL